MNLSSWKVALLIAGSVLALAGGVVIGVLLARGSADASPEAGPAVTSPTDEGTEGGSGQDSTATTRPPRVVEGCDLGTGDPFVGGQSTTLADLGEVDGLRVEGALYPHPDYVGDPWTQWGQGVALEDGRFFSAIGDHLGPDGNSYVYEFDPETGALNMVGDLLSYVDHEPGSWGYGKVHGQMVPGPCGEIYLASYWGTNNDLQFSGSYEGDILFRLDPEGRTIANLGVPVGNHGVPSLAGAPDLGLVYGEAIDPLREVLDIDEGPFFVYDVVEEEVVFEGPSTPHVGYRSVMVDALGRAYYSIGGGRLAVYDPDANDISEHPSTMPSDWLRAATHPSEDGWVYGVTDEPAIFFSMSPDGDITTLSESRGYTASIALHPDGDRFFYIPDAHGGAWFSGAPLISVDVETGEQTVLAELNPLAEENLGVRLGGTYNISVAPSGDTIYLGMNVSPLGDDSGFGDVALLVVHLP